MIHSARNNIASSEHCFDLILLDFEKWGWTDGQHEYK